MRPLMWLQHRGHLAVVAVLLLVIVAGAVFVTHLADQWLVDYETWLGQLQSAGCPLPADDGARIQGGTAACQALLERYPLEQQEAFARAFEFAIPVFEEGLVLVVVIVAALIGAPLVAREAEQRTHVVAWTQSVSRRRWYLTKTLVLGGGLLITGLVAGIANDRVQIPLTRGGLTLSRWPWFFSIDLAPAGEAVLAFALAVACGAYLRRTLAAVGAALMGFLLLFLTTAWAVRSLTPLSYASGPRDTPDDSWMIGGAYHPATHYWPLQVLFLALLLALAGVSLAAGWRATRARSTV